MPSKKLPIVISAPHAHTKIPKIYRERISLNDHQIWRFSDPFTDKTCRHPQAAHIHIGRHHRLLGDLNREPRIDYVCSDKDYYGNPVWKPNQGLTNLEKAELLGRNWFPYYENLIKDIHQLFDKGYKKVLFIDHHNTAADHPLDKNRAYIPSIVISNLGSRNRGNRVKSRGNIVSMPNKAMQFFQKSLQKNTELGTEINQVYKGGNILNWITHHALVNHEQHELYAVQLEYNLNFIYNPLSGRKDRVALAKLRDGINAAITDLAGFLKL
jgi:N-formylglutamate amidohydrolase